jgi:hypothetical protein
LGRPDARSAQIGGPDLITQVFHVSSYSGEPVTSKRARNLFSKRDCRGRVCDNVTEDWPKVPLICGSATTSGAAKRLAWAGCGSDGEIIWPAGDSKREWPPSNASEEVLLGVVSDFIGFNIFNAAMVYVAMRDQPRSDQFTEPRCGVRIIFVVVGTHKEMTPAQPPTSANAARVRPAHVQLGYTGHPQTWLAPKLFLDRPPWPRSPPTFIGVLITFRSLRDAHK